MLKLENLYYLREVAKCGSITQAADRLFLSKSALSAAIRHLEKELGVELLNRSVSGVALNAIGEEVMRKADLIFAIVEQIEKDCRQYQQTEAIQAITYLMPTGMAANLFSDLLRLFRPFLNGARITIKSTNSAEKIIAEVKARPDAVGFWFSQQPLHAPELLCEKIGECEIGIIAKKHSRYIPDEQTELAPADLLSIPLIEYSMEDTDWTAQEAADPFRGLGDQMNVVLTVDNQTIFYEALDNDLGVGMSTKISMNSSAKRRNALRFIPVSGSGGIDLYMLTHEQFSAPLRQKHKQVLQKVLEEKQD